MIDALNTAYPLSEATVIMDTGCGSGLVTDLLIREYGKQLPKSVRLITADFSAGMVKQVQERQKKEVAQGNLVWSQVKPAVYDAQDLSGIADGSLSHILGGFVFFMLPQPRLALKEALRVLTAENGGGVLALTSFRSNEWTDMLQLVKVVRPDLTVPAVPQTWASVEGVCGELEATGFREVKGHTMPTFMQLEDPVATVNLMVKGLPHMSKVREEMKPEEIDQACDLMVQHLRSNHPQLPSRMVGTAIVAIGRK